MSTIATTEAASAPDRALRMLPIAANLLPTEIIDERRARRVRGIVVRALGGFVLVLAAWYGLVSWETAAARSDLNTAQDQAQHLLQQQRAFAEVARTQAESHSINAQLSTLLASDLRWSTMLGSLQSAAPRGVQLTSVSGVLIVDDAAGGRTTNQVPTPKGDKPVATLTITGVSSSKAAIAAYADALSDVPGLASPVVNSANVQDRVLQFNVRLDVTKSALSGRYTSKSNKRSGEN